MEKEGLGYGRRGKFPNSLHPSKTPWSFRLLLLSWKLWGTNHFNKTLALIASNKLVWKIFKTLTSTWSECKCTRNYATICKTCTQLYIFWNLNMFHVNSKGSLSIHEFLFPCIHWFWVYVYLSIWNLILDALSSSSSPPLGEWDWFTNWSNWVSRWSPNFFSFLFPSFFSSHAVLELEFECLFCSISFKERRQGSRFFWVGEFTSLSSHVVCEFWPTLQKMQSCQRLLIKDIYLGFVYNFL